MGKDKSKKGKGLTVVAKDNEVHAKERRKKKAESKKESLVNIDELDLKWFKECLSDMEFCMQMAKIAQHIIDEIEVLDGDKDTAKSLVQGIEYRLNNMKGGLELTLADWGHEAVGEKN